MDGDPSQDRGEAAEQDGTDEPTVVSLRGGKKTKKEVPPRRRKPFSPRRDEGAGFSPQPRQTEARTLRRGVEHEY